jgi:hypothetical protein
VNPLKARTLSRAFSNGSIFVFNLSSEANAVMSPPTDKLVPSKVKLDEVAPLLEPFLKTT